MFPNMYYEAIFDLSDDIPRGETYDVALAIELGQSFGMFLVQSQPITL